ncbi:hypothetical protein IQ06DRAFT_335059 [Phaeosphaeriaceae sp. SRC1lsM3a]|nr:hypothetical protein IQ06DRAFT_335059 [Stagonospora sp. SRC1lsM3a]
MFPAYRDYIRGTSMRQSIDGHHFIVIPGTDSSNVTTNPEDVLGPASYRRAPSPAVLDLRSPSSDSALTRLIPPESVHPAPSPSHDEGVTPTGSLVSAERSRRRLLETSQQRAPAVPQTSSQQLLHNLRQAASSRTTPRRRGKLTRQATKSSLLRSSSATDVDSEPGQTAPSVFGSPDVFASPLARRSVPITLIRPGEILNYVRFAVFPEHIRQQMNAQLAKLWIVANTDPEPSVRNAALAKISTASTQILKMLESQENALRTQSDQGKQTAGLPKLILHQQQPRQDPYVEQPPVAQQSLLLQGQCRSSARLQAQRDVPIAAVSDNVRHFVDAKIPEYFAAMRCVGQSAGDSVMRQRAQTFLEKFNQALPPEGHNYLKEILQRVAIDEMSGLHD